MSDREPRLRLGLNCGLILALLFLSAGCGQDAKLGRVHGVVRIDGKPLATGTVRFVPDAGRAASGQIQSDGTYSLGTYGKADGALIGTHRVAIIAYQKAEVAESNTRPADVTAVNPNVKPLVPARYMAVGTSGLTFEVKPGDNPKDFDLTSK
jgi:hypothetical protein